MKTNWKETAFRGDFFENLLVEQQIPGRFGLIWSIISKDVTVNGGLGSESSRHDPTFQVYEWLECIEICPGPLLMLKNQRHSLRCENIGSNYINQQFLSLTLKTSPPLILVFFSGLITVKISSLVVSLYVFLRRKWRVIHLVLHPLVFWCISLYIHNTYTWNPNGGVDLKKIEVIWLPGIYIYIYIHTPIYQYNIPHLVFCFFWQSSPFQLDLPKTL